MSIYTLKNRFQNSQNLFLTFALCRTGNINLKGKKKKRAKLLYVHLNAFFQTWLGLVETRKLISVSPRVYKVHAALVFGMTCFFFFKASNYCIY